MHVAVSKCCDVLRHYVTANKHTNRTEWLKYNFCPFHFKTFE
jgi:hypothetical protein